VTRKRGRSGSGLELAAELADVHAQRLLLGLAGAAPDVPEHVGVGDDLAGVGREMRYWG
jgi:hypothetical protein